MLSPRKLDCPSDAELECSAFNAAFYELGLRWHWDSATYERLSAEPGEDRSRVQRYLEQTQPHLLRAYDAGFLADAVVTAKQRAERALAHCRRDALPRFDWSDPRGGEVGF